MRKVNLKKYAKAVLKVAKDNNIFEQLQAELIDVAQKMQETPDLKKFLLDPHVDLAKKKKALDTVFQDFISKKTYNFLILLIKDKKLNYLDQIVELIKKTYLEEEAIVEIITETVIALDSDQEEEIKKIITQKTGKQVLLKSLINEDLIGGLKIIIKDQVIDGSIAGKIFRLKQKINTFE